MFIKTKKLLIVALLSFFVIFFATGCRVGVKNQLKRDVLFSLPIGKTEKAIAVFNFSHVPFTQKIRLVMKDGFFYISNGSVRKIMQFNSYGDLLSLIYNSKENPMPVRMETTSKDGNVTNKSAVAYPFRNIGEFAVGSGNSLLVGDEVMSGRGVFDSETGTMMDQIVLRFNRQGELIDYLGQEGIGGTPFPYIEHLQVNSSGEISVITRTMKGWVIFWYSVEGNLLYKITISFEQLPVPMGSHAIPSLENIYADPDRRELYLKMDYYRGNESTDGTAPLDNMKFDNSRVYTLNIEDEKYENLVELPKYYLPEDKVVIVSTEKEEGLYEFIGAASGGYLFFLGPDVDTENEFLILDRSGKVILRKNIVVQDRELIYRAFHISPEGILSGLLCEEDSVKLVWWRSDKVIKAKKDEK